MRAGKTNLGPMSRLLFACLAGASALHDMDGHLLRGCPACQRVLVFGCSVDRNAFHAFCGSRGGSRTDHVSRVWCEDDQLNIKLAFMFHHGVGLHGDLADSDLHHGLSTGRLLERLANKFSLKMLQASPHLVVVDSSLWDLYTWRKNGVMPESRVAQWCQHDLPKLMGKVSRTFPGSRIAFRTAPTIQSDAISSSLEDGSFAKFERHDIETLYHCINSSTTNGLLFGKYEIIDFHAIMAKLIDRNVPNLFQEDGYHPNFYPSMLYMNEIFRRVGLNPQDPPEPQLGVRRSAEYQAQVEAFEAATQGDLNEL